MNIRNFLKDLTDVTKDEMEKISIPVPLDASGKIQLSSSDWKEIDGISYLNQPVKADYILWGQYTMDCGSLIFRSFGSNILCVLAFSISKEATNRLGNAYSDESLGYKGYSFFFGFSNEETHALD